MPSVSQSLQLNPGHLSYMKSGSGPAVVIIHGIGGHKEDWSELSKALDSKHSVYTIDMLGFGGSSKDLASITISQQADAVIRLLDAHKVQKADLVGNSVGGWVAAMVAANNPNRVRRLVLVDAAGFKAMFQGPSPVNFYPINVTEMKQLLSVVRHAEAAHTDAAAESALSVLKASGDAQAAETIFKGMEYSERLEDVADKVTAPTLVIWGADDKLFPPTIANLVVQHIKSAKKTIIPEASHFPQLDNPTVFNSTVTEFLAH